MSVIYVEAVVEVGLVEEEEVPTTSEESRNILEQSNDLSEVESEKTKDQ